jgi:hypothetical protein
MILTGLPEFSFLKAGPVKSVRSAEEVFKIHFYASVIDAVVAETNWYAAEFSDTQKDELK